MSDRVARRVVPQSKIHRPSSFDERSVNLRLRRNVNIGRCPSGVDCLSSAPMGNRGLNFGVGILATILVGWVMYVGASIIQPFVIALLLCVLLGPIVDALKRFYIPAPVTIVVLVVLLFFGLTRIGGLIGSNVAVLLDRVQIGDAGQLDPFNEQQQALAESGRLGEVLATLSQNVESWNLPPDANRILQDGLTAVRKLDFQNLVPDVAQTGVSFLQVFALIIIYMVFIFAEQAVFRRKILSVTENKKETKAALDAIARGIQRYLGVKTVISLATSVLCYSVLVALSIPFAVLWGLLTFFLNFIPTFGSIIAGIFPTVTALAVGGIDGTPSVEKALTITGCYMAINMVLGYYVEPRVLGRELNLSPLVIVLSVVVWAGLWGIPGAFLSVPMTAALQIVLANTETTRPIAVLLSSGPPPDEGKGA